MSGHAGKPEDLKSAVIDALKTVYDPEIPVNIWEVGLIYDVRVGAGEVVEIEMTLTSPACPVAGSLPGEVEMAARSVPGVTEANGNCGGRLLQSSQSVGVKCEVVDPGRKSRPQLLQQCPGAAQHDVGGITVGVEDQRRRMQRLSGHGGSAIPIAAPLLRFEVGELLLPFRSHIDQTELGQGLFNGLEPESRSP